MEVLMLYKLADLMDAACAANRVNGKYTRKDAATVNEPANVHVMQKILAESADLVTDEDREKSAKIITYLNEKIIELIAETLGDYWKTAVLLVDRQDIGQTDYKTMAFVASVPNSYDNAVARDQVDQDIRLAAEKSSYMGQIGDAVAKQSMTILGAVYSRNYFKWYHTAVTKENNLVRFPLADKLDTGKSYDIAGKIHKLGDSNTTILHYVRVKNS
jgi:hypothetical protein